MAAKAGAAFFALFDWRWPMRCHLISKSAVSASFCRASWTLFSPKSRCPAAYAARTCSALNVFETARRRMSAGGRPAAAAAAAIRSRIAARLPTIACTYLCLLDGRDDRLGGVGVLARRLELQIGLELRLRVRRVAGIEIRH